MTFNSISVVLQGSFRSAGGEGKRAVSQRIRLEGDSGLSARHPHQGDAETDGHVCKVPDNTAMGAPGVPPNGFVFRVVVCWYHVTRICGTEGLKSGWRSSLPVH